MPLCKQCGKEISERVYAGFEGLCPDCARKAVPEKYEPLKVTFKDMLYFLLDMDEIYIPILAIIVLIIILVFIFG